MFRRLYPNEQTISILVDGVAIEAAKTDTVATALLVAGIERFRLTPKTAAPRGPYCGMGVCFECLVTINGVGNRQACLIAVQEGMVVETGAGVRQITRESTP